MAIRRSPMAFALYLLRWHYRVLWRTVRQPAMLITLVSWFLFQAALLGVSIFAPAHGGLINLLTFLESFLLFGALSGIASRHLESLFGNALGFLSLAPVPPATIALFATGTVVGEALAAGTLMVLPVAVVLTLRLHSLWGLAAGAVLLPFTAALLMVLPVGINLLALRLLPPGKRRLARGLASLPTLVFFLLMPLDTNPAWPVRWPVRLLIEASRGQTGLLSRAALPLLLATVLMLILAIVLSLSALSRSLTHLQPTHSPDGRVPSRRLPGNSGRLHFWLLTLTARRQKLLLVWLLTSLFLVVVIRFQSQFGGAQNPGLVVFIFTGSISMIGLNVFLPEGLAVSLPYLWPVPLERFWRERTLWLLGQGVLLAAIYSILLALAGQSLPVSSLLLALSLFPGIVVWGSYLAIRFRLFVRKGGTIPTSRIAIPLGLLALAEGAALLEVLFHAHWPLLLAVNGALLVIPFLVVPALLAKPGPHRYPL